MYQYKTIHTLTKIVIGGIWISLIVKGIAYICLCYAAWGPGALDEGADDAISALMVLLSMLVFFVVAILFLRWTYRASVNAHAEAGRLPISPGWAVGWYFVPIANLWKPFQAIRQTWLASRYGSDWVNQKAVSLLGWWWGLAILVSFLDNMTWRMIVPAPAAAAGVGLVDALLTIPVSLLLMRIMRQVAQAQDATRQAGVFG